MGQKVLLIKLSSLGDVIFNIPLANRLKEAGYDITWLVSEKGRQVVENNPCVDKAIFVPAKIRTLKEFFRIIKTLRAEKFDIAIDAQMMFKSLFLLAFCGAKRRITSNKAREFAQFGGNERVDGISYHPNCHIVLNYLKYAEYLGCDIKPENIKMTLPRRSDEQIKHVDSLLSEIDKAKPTVVIAPATTWENKHWAKDNWREIVKYLEGKVNIVFTGSSKDTDLINDISMGFGTNLAGKTDILELAEVFSRSDLVLAPDSGSSYLAWASEKPKVISIFTCTPKEILGPIGDKNKYCSIGGGKLECQPCFKRKCKLKDKNRCTIYPTSEEVIDKIREFID